DPLAERDSGYSPERRMLGVEWHGPGYHTRVPNGTWAHPTRESLAYALDLLRTGKGWQVERAAAIVRQVLTLQDTDPLSPTYGIWPWLLEEPLAAMAPPDWNWADFCGALLAEMLAVGGDALPGDLAAGMRASLGHAAWSIFRRNVRLGYTNIAIMGAGVALAAGTLLAEPRLAEYGRCRLRAIVEYTAEQGGFAEYNSPTYTLVALRECERIVRLVDDPAARAGAEWLRREAWRTIAEHYHPGTGQWAGPHSRTYGDRLDAGSARALSAATGVAIPTGADTPPARRGGAGLDLPCSPEFVARFRALPADPTVVRRRFIRRDSDDTSTWGTTWLTGDACLGTVNADNLWTQRRPLLGYWRGDAGATAELRLRFLHDGDDFASAFVRNAQEGERVLSAVGLLTNMGDTHHTLDRPTGGRFEAADFRLRYELSGAGVATAQLAADRFALSAGGWRAIVHAVPGRFGPRPVEWQLGAGDDRIWLDAVCYRGPRRPFDPAELGEVALAAGLELLPAGQPPAAVPPRIGPPNDGVADISWPIGAGLRIVAPLVAQPYPR
ncbi:MAG: hypothetical protein AVDCRST_MAG88-3889, partial [uncultured Thermomicrobiales bacterium]